MRRVALAALALALAAGCGTPPDENACANIREVSLNKGHRGPNGEWIVGEWVPGPPDADPPSRLHWTAFTTFAVCHELGREHVSVECWASFTSNGAFAQQIGNVCQVIPTCKGFDGGVFDGGADDGGVVDGGVVDGGGVDSGPVDGGLVDSGRRCTAVLVRNSGAQDFWVRLVIR